MKTWVSNYFEKTLDKQVAHGKQGSLHLRDVVKELQGVATTDHNMNVTKVTRWKEGETSCWCRPCCSGGGC